MKPTHVGQPNIQIHYSQGLGSIQTTLGMNCEQGLNDISFILFLGIRLSLNWRIHVE
jgi:hypothetical protein